MSSPSSDQEFEDIVRDLVRLTRDVVQSPADDTKFGDWCIRIRNVPTAALVQVTARLSSQPGKDSRDIKALREAIIAEVARQNAQAVIQTMQRLDATAAKLTWISLLVAVVGVLVAIVGVVQVSHR